MSSSPWRMARAGISRMRGLKYPSLVLVLSVFSLNFSGAAAGKVPESSELSIGTTVRVSVDSNGVQGNDSSGNNLVGNLSVIRGVRISADGQHVVFQSIATNLVPGDTNNISDIFVRDLQTGTTIRASVATGGAQANAPSVVPSISADGRYVAFFSDANNLVAGDTNSMSDIFVHDMQTSTTIRASVSTDGVQGNGGSVSPTISADGRYVAFLSGASNLITGDTNGIGDIFVRDLQAGITVRASVSTAGAATNAFTTLPVISADGRYVAFESSATNLVSGDTNGQRDIFVRDLLAGITVRASVSSGGSQGNRASLNPAISADGRYVAFSSGSTNLVPGDTNGNDDIFLRDLQTGTTTRVSLDSNGAQMSTGGAGEPSISADGRYVAFDSWSSALVSGDTNNRIDIFVRDRELGTTTRVSVASDGTQANHDSDVASISADGRLVAFESGAANLVAEDTNGVWDVFVHDLQPTVREPVILIPGFPGSRIYATADFNWSQSNGHGGTFDNDGNPYKADEEIWINTGKIAFSASDDYFDVLSLEKDGKAQSTSALYGVDLEAREIVDEVFGIDFYNNLLTDLENAGYQRDVNLFTFPYDWRMDVATNAELLDQRVLDVLEIANGTPDRSQWTITQVDLLAHSMGGLVGREYINNSTRAARVDQLIAMGSPYLGAPLLLKGVLFGDPLFPCVLYGENLCALNPDEIKDIIQNMPTAFQAGPGNAYWKFYDGSPGNPIVFQEDRDFDADGQVLGALSYTELKNMLFVLDRDAYLDWDGTGKDINQTVFRMGESFHDRLDFSWDSGIPVPEVDLIAGTGLCTLGQIRPSYRISFDAPFVGPVRIGPIVRLSYVNGDKTVPLFSTSLYDPARGLDHRGGANVYYVAKKFAEHAYLPSKDPVRELVLNLLVGDTSMPDGILAEVVAPKGCSGTVINVESPVELHATDNIGNHTGWTTLPDTGEPVIQQGIPGSSYDEIEENKSVYLPDDGVYTISLNATGSGSFNLILHLYKSDGTVQSIVYLRAPLTTTTTGEMIFDTSAVEPPLLRLDHNGDGIFDDTMEATSVLGATESADSQPPQIGIFSPRRDQTLVGGALISWQSSDALSGVLNEWGYIDMDTPSASQITNGIVASLPTGEHTLTVLAEDRLGNATQEQIPFTVYPFEWLSPAGGSELYSAKAGNTIPVKFSVQDLNGTFVQDESVELSLLNAFGNTIAGPFVFASNPSQGVAILGNGHYHHNLQTRGLPAGEYTLRVTFNSAQVGGTIELVIILR